MGQSSVTPNDPWDPRNPENRDRTNRLQGELRTRLLAWDPVGIADAPEAQDEYDGMIGPLMRQLHAGASQIDVARWLTRKLEQDFGLPSQQEREARLATELITWWRESTGPEARPATGA